MIIKVYERVGNISIQQRVVRVVKVYDTNIPSGISADVLTEAGSMVVATGASTPAETGGPTADGQVWTANLALAKKGEWKIPDAGGGGIAELTNKSANSVVLGDVLIFNPSYDEAFTTTTTQADIRVVGVAIESIGVDAEGNVATGAGTKVTVKCDTAAISRGQYLITSTTVGRATGGDYFRSPAAFAVAITSKAGGSTGTVEALLIDNFYQAIAGSAGWAMGGYNGAVVTTVQKLTMATETIATVAGAALPYARHAGFGMGYSTTAAYHTHGSNTYAAPASAVSSRYKMPYATETFSSLTNSGGTKSFGNTGGTNFSAQGYVSGGYDTGSVATTANQKTVFATDTETDVARLTTGRAYQGGVSDGTYAYIGGDGAVTDKLTASTDTCSATASAYLANPAAGYLFVSFPATAGYRAYNDGTWSYSRKLTYATATDANHSSSLTGNHRMGYDFSDGNTIGYVGSPTVASKIPSSTGTYASTTATCATTYNASASNGAY